MLENEEKRVAQEESEGKNNEEAQEAANPEEVKEAVLKSIKKELIEKTGMSEEEAEQAFQMLEEAQMPVKLNDTDFKCGPQELDIRYLSKANRTQYFFRTLLLNGVYLRNISKSLLDVTNLLFVIIDALGVKDIIKASDDVIAKVTKEHERREKEKEAEAAANQEEPNKDKPKD